MRGARRLTQGCGNAQLEEAAAAGAFKARCRELRAAVLEDADGVVRIDLRNSSTRVSALRVESARLPPKASWITPERHPSKTSGLI